MKLVRFSLILFFIILANCSKGGGSSSPAPASAPATTPSSDINAI